MTDPRSERIQAAPKMSGFLSPQNSKARAQWLTLLDAALGQPNPSAELRAALEALKFRRGRGLLSKGRLTDRERSELARRVGALGIEAKRRKYTPEQLTEMGRRQGRLAALARWAKVGKGQPRTNGATP